MGESYAYDAEAIDADGDILVYSLVEYPEGMTIDPSTGLIEWQVPEDYLTQNAVTFFDGDFNPVDWEVETYGNSEAPIVSWPTRLCLRTPV